VCVCVCVCVCVLECSLLDKLIFPWFFFCANYFVIIAELNCLLPSFVNWINPLVLVGSGWDELNGVCVCAEKHFRIISLNSAR